MRPYFPLQFCPRDYCPLLLQPQFLAANQDEHWWARSTITWRSLVTNRQIRTLFKATWKIVHGSYCECDDITVPHSQSDLTMWREQFMWRQFFLSFTWNRQTISCPLTAPPQLTKAPWGVFYSPVLISWLLTYVTVVLILNASCFIFWMRWNIGERNWLIFLMQIIDRILNAKCTQSCLWGTSVSVVDFVPAYKATSKKTSNAVNIWAFHLVSPSGDCW